MGEVVVQSLSRIQLFATSWTAACQASPSSTLSWSLLRLKCIESMMPFSHLALCYPLLLPPSIFPSIRVLSSESALCIRWPKYWNFSFSIITSLMLIIYFCSLVVGVWEFTRFFPGLILSFFFFFFCFSSDFYLSLLVGT